MTTADFSEMLADARAGSRAAVAFTCYDLVTAAAVLAGAEAASTGVILLVSAGSATSAWGGALISGMAALAASSGAPGCVQLDHCADLEVMKLALQAGAGAIMADGSRLDDEDNARLVERAVALARRYGAGVEAELGHISGDEESASGPGTGGSLTDPAAAERFIARTGADCLAVSIGNVHGRYPAAPVLDLDRLDEIRRRVPVPLALHGASGLDGALARASIAHGIAKVNVNQELRSRWFSSVQALVEPRAADLALLSLQGRLADDLQAAVGAKLAALTPSPDSLTD